jgi:hypothetical protein
MFSANKSDSEITENLNDGVAVSPPIQEASQEKQNSQYGNEVNYNMIDDLLEKEKIRNKSEAWNKLDKTVKIQKLHAFSEKYGKDHNLPMKDVKSLKQFFIESLDKNKLQKTKDVNYDKEVREIISIPSLHFNNTTNNFTLKNMDAKRVSTLKSLTPKRLA